MPSQYIHHRKHNVAMTQPFKWDVSGINSSIKYINQNVSMGDRIARDTQLRELPGGISSILIIGALRSSVQHKANDRWNGPLLESNETRPL